MPRNGANVYSPPAGTLATTLTTIASPPYNAFVNDLTADANLARPIVAGGTGATSVAAAQTALTVVGYSAQTLTAAQQAQARANISAALNGQRFGLTLSNNATDAVNDIDIAVGEAASSESNPVLMVLASALTKRLDAAWAVGTGNGGLDTGSVADNTYHVWLIQRSDTNVVDALFSLSATAPTMPTSYDRKKRIGSVIRSGATILPFRHVGSRTFVLNSSFTVRSSTSALAASLLTFAVPAGIQCEPLVGVNCAVNASSTSVTNIGSALAGIVTTNALTLSSTAATTMTSFISGGFLTNTSQQLYMSVSIPAGTLSAHTISNSGWIDSYL